MKLIKWIWMVIVWVFSLIFASSVAAGASIDNPGKDGYYHEDYYNMKYCSLIGGEYNSKSGSFRLDCETTDVAWEGEWIYNNSKMYQAIGQSMIYAKSTGKKPGILFYVRKKSDMKRVEMAKRTFEYFDIDYEIKVFEVKKEK